VPGVNASHQGKNSSVSDVSVFTSALACDLAAADEPMNRTVLGIILGGYVARFSRLKLTGCGNSIETQVFFSEFLWRHEMVMALCPHTNSV
jgi:hypothetical protein